MPICPICDDTGLQNSDSAHPEFCYCSAGKQARRQWEASHAGGQGKGQPKPANAMRASLLGSASGETSASTRHPSVQLLYQVAHAGHEVSVVEATQLYDLAKALEGFLIGLTPIGRNMKR